MSQSIISRSTSPSQTSRTPKLTPRQEAARWLGLLGRMATLPIEAEDDARFLHRAQAVALGHVMDRGTEAEAQLAVARASIVAQRCVALLASRGGAR